MKKPVIGVTCPWSVETWEEREDGGYYYVGQPYVEAVAKYGGVPILLAPEYSKETLDDYIENLLDLVDGILFSGGGDVKKKYPDGLPNLRDQQPHRYDFDAALLKGAYDRKIPILGICRGFQMILEVFGSSLSDELVEGHKQNISGSLPWHGVDINEDSDLYDVLKISDWKVNSFHVQQAGQTPKGFIVSAKAKDGVVEAIEAEDYPFLVGYQFHPEELSRTDDKAGDLFRWFINATKVKG